MLFLYKSLGFEWKKVKQQIAVALLAQAARKAQLPKHTPGQDRTGDLQRVGLTS